MQIDVPGHIEKLLFLHDTLTIPDFGTFTATKSSATADYIGGTVAPPSKSLTFSENITTDDGILVNDVAVAHGISTEEARSALAEYVEKIQGLLSQREIVTLPAVGRLYKNYVQKIQFLPDTTNFSPESFGLPPLQFSPIARSREVEKSPEPPPPAPAVGSVIKTPATPPSTQFAPPPPPPPMPEPYTPTAARSGGAGWATGLGIVLLLCAFAGGYWLWQRQQDRLAEAGTDVTERATTPLPGSGKTNELPKKVEKPVFAEEVKKEPAKEEDFDKQVNQSLAEKTQAARDEAKNSKTAAKGARECILIVATLREKANADRLEQMLKEEGFDVYLVRKNGYQVGIQFFYSNASEVQEKIATLKHLTGEKEIWVKKR